MNHRHGFGALGVSAFVVAVLVAGCGDYGGAGDDDDTATGGTAASQATGGVGAGAPTGGGGTGTGGAGAVQASCDNVQPCGGDVLGTWTVAGACVALGGEMNLEAMGTDCDFGTLTGSTLNVSGTLTFNDGSSYEDNLVWTGEARFDLIGDCRRVSGTITQCDRLASSSLPGVGYVEGLNFDLVVCTPTGDDVGDVLAGCNCTATINQTGTSAGYEIVGNVITTSNGAEYSYCVDGNTLTLTPTKFALDASTTNTGTVVFQKM